MSFSSSPMKKPFDFVFNLEQLDENRSKLEEGLEEKYKKKNKNVPKHRLTQMEDIKVVISDMREMLKAVTPAVEAVNPEVIVPTENKEQEKSEIPVTETVNQEVAAKKVEPAKLTPAELDTVKIVTGAYLELKALIKGLINFGYLVNHIDEAIGVTKENPMDVETEKECRGLCRHYKEQKQIIAQVKELNTVKLINEALSQEIQNFKAENLHKVKTKDRHAMISELRDADHKSYTDESIKDLDGKIVKQAKLVMKDVQGPVPEKSEGSSYNPINWLRSMRNNRHAPVKQPVQKQEEVAENVVRKKM